MAPRLQRSVNMSASRLEPFSRPKPKRSFYMFMVAQFVIALLAFVFVRDYMSNGAIKQALAGAFGQEASPASEYAGANAEEVVVGSSSPVPSDAESAQVQNPVIVPEPEPAELDESSATAAIEPAPQVAAQESVAPVEPEPVAIVPEPEPAAIESEPVPEPTVEAETEPEPQVEVQQVAAAAVTDIGPAKSAAIVAPTTLTDGSQQKEGLTFRDCEGCPELVSVDAGQYLVDAGGQGVALPAKSSTPQEVVVDKPFAIGRYEITFDEWDRCVSAGVCTSQPDDDGWGRGRKPVIHVSYNDITEQYLPWLSKISGYSYRLPTEAEWELASQGGSKSSKGQIQEAGSKAQVACSYGNSSDVAAKTRENIWAGVGCNDGFVYTAPVGSLMPNSLGLFDMHGNVWEWVSDCWRGPYDSEEDASSGGCKFHVLRGGSWASEFRFLRDGIWVGDAVAYRSAVRGWETVTKARNSIGFRVARSLQ